jgi:hypothetical protein
VKQPSRIAAALILAGCSSTSEPLTGDIARDLQHADPRFRAQAARLAVEQNRVDLAPDLVKVLSDDDAAVRMWAGIALRKLTGQDFDFRPYAGPVERDEAIGRWESWLRAEAGEQARRTDG